MENIIAFVKGNFVGGDLIGGDLVGGGFCRRGVFSQVGFCRRNATFIVIKRK